MAWLLFSSGARPQYLENDVRCLALLPNMTVQFRYEEAIVTPSFRKGATDGTAVGSTAYVAYLDNRNRDAATTFVLIREVTIASCEVRGTSYILKLTAKRYVDRQANTSPEATVAGWALDRRPGLEDQKTVDFWVTELSQALPDSCLVAHDPVTGKHLKAFEATAAALATHSDFETDERKLFLNIIDVRDRKNASVVLPKRRRLKAGESYRLLVYHYFKELGTHAAFKPCWINVRSNSSHLQLRSATSVKIASEYDEKEIIFSLDAQTCSEAVGIDLALCTAPQNTESLLDIHFDFNARAQWIWLWLRVATITAGLSAAQLSVLIAEQKYSSGALAVVVGASFIAALASVFKSLPRSI